jgi:hypothetical protein
VDTSRVLSLKFLGDMWQKALVDVVCDERCERGQSAGKSVKNLEEGVQSVLRIVETKFTLQPLAVETNVPVGSSVDKIE